MRVVMFRSVSGPKRVILILLLFLLAVVFVLPTQSQGLLQNMGGPVADVVSFPLAGLAALRSSMDELWSGYVALKDVHAENERLRRQIEALKGQNNELREAAAATDRLASLLRFREQEWPRTVAARVIGRDATNWYRGILLDKGERDGIAQDMGVITQAGMVGRVVKTTAISSVVLLVTDPNTAVTALIQRTRDEGLVTGTPRGLLRMKYIPLLSTVQEGDIVVTSGLVGSLPKGLMIGVVKRIEGSQDDLFQSAELVPVVDFSKLEEVLVITAARPS